MHSKNERSEQDRTIKHIVRNLLPKTAVLWFAVAVIGQWLFATYVALFYGGAAINNDFMKWNRVLPHGYVEGETMGNLAVGIHVFFAAVILFGGPLQFIPFIRNRFKAFHRLNGRFYLITMVLVSISGIYMVLTKGTISGLVGDISVSINGVLILVFAYLTLRFALQRKFEKHGQWAFRLFLVANGVWFFRIGLMFWLLIHGRPVGFDPETFTGPFLVVLGFGQYLIPIAVYEGYRKAIKSGGLWQPLGSTLIMIMAITITAIGIFAATLGMWLPRISG
ncbi:DUF2306 domain-containing protein [Flagellimonas sp. DF-77]|uniref:DUF2306 domain-containing protein n=1 Tax=Flagellimonas algarum TaxID=3230298 RepID=UPI003390F2F3